MTVARLSQVWCGRGRAKLRVAVCPAPPVLRARIVDVAANDSSLAAAILRQPVIVALEADQVCVCTRSQPGWGTTGRCTARGCKSPRRACVCAGVRVPVRGGQEAFQFYSAGVLTGACGDKTNHFGLAVGFGNNPEGGPYFKVKNSWGASWGQAGYVLIARGESYNSGNGQCGIYTGALYPNAH